MKSNTHLSVVRDEFCEKDSNLANLYNRSQHFCSRKDAQLCGGTGPIYGLDAYDTGEPYWYLVGIASVHFADSCPGYQTMTRITDFIYWINENVYP